MSPVRGLLSRLRGRGVGPSPGVGLRFLPAMEEEWKELEEQVDAHAKRPGTALVSSWEVAASELARATLGRDDEKLLIDRFSDGLVPALTPFQDVHKGVPSAIREGLEAGRREGSMAAATRPLVMLVNGLDAKVGPGWAKTVDYLEPLYAIAPRPEAARAAMAPVGGRFAQGCRDAETVLRERLAQLPRAANLWDGVLDPFEAWQLTLGREIEMSVYEATRGMVAAIRGDLPSERR